MPTIFVKYNRERLPCFQTATKIVMENGVLKAIKLPLSSLAVDHVNTIYNNYELLTQKYPHAKLCQPKFAGSNLEFEIARGKSFEKLLKQALDVKDREQFFGIYKKYLDYVDSFVNQRQVKFEPSSFFMEVFGEWRIGTLEDIIDITNVDLTFSNLFVSEDEIIQIDYEWVFAFAIPKSFIIWRSIVQFFAYYGAAYSSLIAIKEVFAITNIRPEQHEQFLLLDKSLQKIVYGEGFKYLLKDENLQPQVDIFAVLKEKNYELNIRNQELAVKFQEIAMQNLELEGLNNKIAMQNLQLENLNNIIKTLVNSISWRITSPMRKLCIIMRQLRNKLKKN